MPDRARIITPKTNKNHHTVGHYYAGHSYESKRIEIYFCDSYDPRQGYWMTNVNRKEDRKNVSERAIDRTFMEAQDRGDHWWVTRWSERYSKADLAKPALPADPTVAAST